MNVFLQQTWSRVCDVLFVSQLHMTEEEKSSLFLYTLQVNSD